MAIKYTIEYQPRSVGDCHGFDWYVLRDRYEVMGAGWSPGKRYNAESAARLCVDAITGGPAEPGASLDSVRLDSLVDQAVAVATFICEHDVVSGDPEDDRDESLRAADHVVALAGFRGVAHESMVTAVVERVRFIVGAL